MQIHNSARRYTEPAIAEADAWLEQRACNGIDTKVFFPTGSDPRHSSQARKICAECPVKEPCLAYGLEHNMPGVWGGTSGNDRRKMKRGTRRRVTS